MKNLRKKLHNCKFLHQKTGRIIQAVRVNSKLSALLLCFAALMTCVSLTFAWFGSSFENLNTQIKMGEYSARISVYDENAELVASKTAKNGETVSFDTDVQKTGWSSGKTGVYYLYVENLGDIDFKTSVSLSGSFSSDNKQISAFYYDVKDITGRCDSANGFSNYISSAKSESINSIVKDGSSFANAGIENMSETKAKYSSAYALYYGCYNLPYKYYDGKSSFNFSVSVTTTQSLAPQPEESAAQNAQITESTTAPVQSVSSAEKTESVSSAATSQNPSNSEWEWKYNDSKHTAATLVKYKGDKKEILLPSIADKAIITGLDSGLLSGTGVTKVTVPATVNKFDGGTFNVKTLKTIEFQEKTKANDTIYTSPFTCENSMILTSDGTALIRVLPQLCKEELTLPTEITAIYDGAFSGCASLEKLNIKSVSVFNADTFSGCELKEICLYNNSVVNAAGTDVFGKKNSIVIHTLSSLADEYKNCSAVRGYTVKSDLKDDIYENHRFTEIGQFKYLLMKNGDSFNGKKYEFDGVQEFALVAKCSSKSTALTIPETITCDGKTYKVLALDDNAIGADTAETLEKLVLPCGNFNISSNALSDCKNLKVIQYADSAPADNAEPTDAKTD